MDTQTTKLSRKTAGLATGMRQAQYYKGSGMFFQKILDTKLHRVIFAVLKQTARWSRG